MAKEVFIGDVKLILLKDRTVQRDNEVPSQKVQEGESKTDHIKHKARSFDYTVKVTGDNEAEANSKLQELKQLRKSDDTFRLDSPEDQVDDVAVQKIQDSRSISDGIGYSVRLTLKEVIFTDAGNSEESRSGQDETDKTEKDTGRRSSKETSEEQEEKDRENIFFPGA